jgi:hypothetical protein
MLRSRLAEIDAEMARLAGKRDQLAAMLATTPGPACPDPSPGTWRPVSTPDGDTAITTISTCCAPDTGPEGR